MNSPPILPHTPQSPALSMSLQNQNVMISGASMGIGASIATRLAQEKANLILFARSADKLKNLSETIHKSHGDSIKIFTTTVDVQSYQSMHDAITNVVKQAGPVDILINNAGLALGAPNAFPDLNIEDIVTMSSTNVNGYMFAAYAVLNAGQMKTRGHGIILNITSTTALEIPPFPGESIYHASKQFQEGFTNALRVELKDTSIKVLALRPGVVATHFHEQRVGYDRESYEGFMEGFEPLVAEDVAKAAAWMLSMPERVAVKALDVVPTAQRSLSVFDRGWRERHGGKAV